MLKETLLGGKRCFVYGEGSDILIQPVDEHDLSLLTKEIDIIEELTGKNGTAFTLAAFQIENWNTELSPWEAPPVFGTEKFGDGAQETLSFILKELLPILQAERGIDERIFLGGYSLAGLFSLYSAYQTDRFNGIAAVSPSVWFPGWDTFIRENKILTKKVYLSLGLKEEKARNPVMARVGDNIRLQYDLLAGQNSEPETAILEWNPGNHFVDSERRTAQGFAWLINS